MSSSSDSLLRRKRPARRQAAQRALDNLISASAARDSVAPAIDDSLLSYFSGGNPGIIFSGAGLSVSAGLATFSSGRGADADEIVRVSSAPKKKRKSESTCNDDESNLSIYETAFKRLGVRNGMEAFYFRFLEKQPLACFGFLADVFHQVSRTSPTIAHQAIHAMEASGRLIRHYTMNIDGLATATSTGSSAKTTVWHSKSNPNGLTVELHGTLHHLVCRKCGTIHDTGDVIPLDFSESTSQSKQESSERSSSIPNCVKCRDGTLRFKILMYGDKESHLITKSNGGDDPFQTILAKDVALAKWIVWVGVSFRQQASCEHFEKVLALARQQEHHVPILIVDPRARKAVEDLETAVGSLVDDNGVQLISMASDDFFRRIQHDLQSDESNTNSNNNAGGAREAMHPKAPLV